MSKYSTGSLGHRITASLLIYIILNNNGWCGPLCLEPSSWPALNAHIFMQLTHSCPAPSQPYPGEYQRDHIQSLTNSVRRHFIKSFPVYKPRYRGTHLTESRIRAFTIFFPCCISSERTAPVFLLLTHRSSSCLSWILNNHPRSELEGAFSFFKKIKVKFL